MGSLRRRLIDAVSRRAIDVPPVVSMTQTATIELMNASNTRWPAIHKEASQISALAVAGHTIAGFEAVRLPFSLTSEVATMGCRVNYCESSDEILPIVVSGMPDCNNLRLPDPQEGIMGEVIEAVQRSRELVDGEVPLVVGVTGPLTMAGYMLGINEMLLDVTLNKELLHKILDSTWQVSASFGRALVDNGADIVVLAEPTASIIGPKHFAMLALPYLRRVIKASKSPVVLHVCGKSTLLLEMLVQTGASCLSVDQEVDIAVAKEVVRGRCSVSGNLDPIGVLDMQEPESIIENCLKILSKGVDILSPGCGLSPSTPLENIRSMIRARDFYFGIPQESGSDAKRKS